MTTVTFVHFIVFKNVLYFAVYEGETAVDLRANIDALRFSRAKSVGSSVLSTSTVAQGVVVLWQWLWGW